MILLTSLCAALERLFTLAIVALLAVILAINGLEIVSRSLFAISYQWIYEVNLLLASWLYFIGIFLVYRHGGDITMVGLKTLLPPRLHSGFERAVNAVSAAVFALVGWHTLAYVQLQWPFKTPGVGIPRAAFTLPLLIGVVAVAIQLLADTLRPRPVAATPHADGAAR
ncbi:MAG: TRAP transporter small permease subunit [Alphaproteobacteria bacterium]|nr:TRAP transporter small permease subunit [Alphaproteobacteria bacterium]